MRRIVIELTWLVRLEDLSVPISLTVPIYFDSLVAIYITKNFIFHERTRDVEIECHFIHQQYLVGLISLSYVWSFSQLTDLLIKSLTHHNILHMLDVSSSPLTRGGWGEGVLEYFELKWSFGYGVIHSSFKVKNNEMK